MAKKYKAQVENVSAADAYKEFLNSKGSGSGQAVSYGSVLKKSTWNSGYSDPTKLKKYDTKFQKKQDSWSGYNDPTVLTTNKSSFKKKIDVQKQSVSAADTLKAYMDSRKSQPKSSLPTVTGSRQYVNLASPEQTKSNAALIKDYVASHPNGSGQTMHATDQQDINNFKPLQQDNYQNTENYQYSKKHPILGALKSVGYNQTGSLTGAPAVAINTLSDKKIDQSDSALKDARYANETRYGVMAGVREKLGIKDNTSKQAEISNFLTGTAMDTANSVANSAIWGKAGALMMGLNSAGQQLYDEAGDVNTTKNQATAQALVNGAVETATEYLPMENLRLFRENPATSMKQLVRNIAKETALEGSQESIGQVADSVADMIIKGNNSDILSEFQTRVNSGESQKSAAVNTIGSAIKQVALEGLGGALSGGLSAGVSTGIGTAQQGYFAKQNIAQNYNSQAAGYQDIADSINDTTPEGKTTKNIAQQYANQVKSGKPVTNMQAAYLDNAINDVIEKGNLTQNTADQENGSAVSSIGNTINTTDSEKESVKTTQNDNPSVNAPGQQQYSFSAPFDDTEKGRIASYKNYRAQNESKIYQDFQQESVNNWSQQYDESGKKAFKENFNEGILADQYIKAFNNVYDSARHGLKPDKIDNAMTSLLSKNQLENIYKAGWNDREAAISNISNMQYKERQEKRVGGLANSVPEAPENLKNVLKSMGENYGIYFKITDSNRYDSDLPKNALGGYDQKNGVITVDLASENPLATVSHEMTHWMQVYNPIGYITFKEEAIKSILRNKNIDLDALVDQYKGSYGSNMSRDQLMDEIVSDSTGTFLNDAQFVQKIVDSGDTIIGKRVVKWVSGMIDAIKQLISDRGIRKSSKALQEDLKNYERIRKLWVGLLDEAAQKYQNDDYTGVKSDIVEKHQLKINSSHDSKGKSLSEKQQEFFKDSKIRDKDGKLLRLYHGTPGGGFNIFRPDVSYFTDNRQYAAEYAEKSSQNSHIKSNVENPENKVYEVYLNAKKPFDTRIPSVKKFWKDHVYGEFSRTPLTDRGLLDWTDGYDMWDFIQDNDLDYDAVLLDEGSTVGSDGKSQWRGISYTVKDSNQIKNIDNQNPTDNDDIRYQLDLKDPVEQTKDLIAVHNISENKLEKALQMDGLPMPSIAITKSDIGWNEFGDISLVFRKDTIDPKNKDNKVYSGDAWTAVRPRAEFKLDESKTGKAVREIEDLSDKVNPTYGFDAHTTLRNIEDMINEGEGIDGAADKMSIRPEIQAAYLKDKGINFKVEKKRKSYNFSREIMDEIIAKHGSDIEKLRSLTSDEAYKITREATIDALHKKYPGVKDNYETEIEGYNDLKKFKKSVAITKYYENQGVSHSNAMELENALRNEPEYFHPNYKIDKTIEYIHDKASGSENNAVIDKEATDNNIKAAADPTKVSEWIKDKLKDIVAGKGIRNDKEYLTKNGNRRSWDALHTAYTLENIVKEMKSHDNGESLFGGQGFFGVSQKNYKSIEDIKNDSYRLNAEGEEEKKSEISNRILAVQNNIYERMSSKDKNSFMAMDSIAQNIVDAVRESHKAADIKQYLNKYIDNVTDADAKEIESIVSDIQTMNRSYFEAKPERVVGYDEVAAAVVPSTISDELKNALDDRNINIVTYDPTVEGARKAAVNSLDGIRFQLDVDDSDVPKDLSKENKDLKQANAYLTNMLQSYKNLNPSEKDINRAAAQMIEKYHSNIKQSDLSDKIGRLYKIMRTSDHLDGAELQQTAAAIANQVIDQATYTDPEEQKQWDSFRKTMRGMRIYVPEENVSDLSPDGFGALRKQWFGKINFVKDPKYANETASNAYEQLQQLYPDYFTDYDGLSDDDAAHQIMDVFDRMRPKSSNVYDQYGGTRDEAAYALAQDIMDAYFNVGNQDVKTAYNKTYKQMMDGMTEQIRNEYNDELRKIEIRDAKDLSELKKSYAANEIDANAYIVHRDAIKDYQSQQKQAQAEVWRNHRAKEDDTRQRTVYRNQIMRDSQAMLHQLTDATDRQHAPQELVQPVLDVLKNIDFSSTYLNQHGEETVRTKKAQEFKDSISNLQNVIQGIEDSNGIINKEDGSSCYVTVDPDMVENIKQFSSKIDGIGKLDELSTYDLKTVRDIVTSTRHMIDTANKFISQKNYESIEAAANTAFSDFGNRKNHIELAYGTTFQNMMQSGMLDSYTYFDQIGPVGNDLYDEIRKGLDKKIRNTKAAQDYLIDAKKKNNVSDKEITSWSQDPHVYKIKNADVTATTAQIMSLYLLNKRGQARKHMFAKGESNQQLGGIKFDKVKMKHSLTNINNLETYRVTETDVEMLINTLTPQQKNMADSIGHYLTTVTSELGNEVTMQMYGYKKYIAKDYFPIEVDKNNVTKDAKAIENDTTMLRNMGFTKSVSKFAANPIVIKDIFDVYTRQADSMGSYNAFVIPVDDLQKWYNYKNTDKSIQSEIERVIGKSGNDYMMNLMRDLNGARGKASEYEATNILSGLAKSAAVGANLRTAIQQPTAYARAAAEMDVKYLLQGLAMNPASSGKEWELCKQYAPIAQWKDWGYFDINTGRSMKNVIMGNDTLREKLIEKSMWAAGKGDETAWVRLWYASQAQVKDQNPGLKVGSEEFYQKSGEVFSHIIDTTQVVDSVLHRSDMMKDKSGLVKMYTSFMSEPTKSFNMIFRGISDAYNNKNGARGKLVKVLAVKTINDLLTAAATSVITALRDPDKDKNYGEKWKEAFIQDAIGNINPLNMIPIAKEIVNLIQGYDAQNLNMEGMSETVKLAKEWYKVITGESKLNALGIAYKSAEAASLATGIPIKNFMKDSGALIDTFWASESAANEYAEMKAMHKTSSSANTKDFVKVALKSYAEGDKTTGDKIISDLQKSGIDEDRINSSINTMISKEPEVDAAAQAFAAGSKNEVNRLKTALINKGYSEDTVEKKIDSAVDKLKPYSYEEIGEALTSGSEESSKKLKELESFYQKQGKDIKAVTTGIKTAMTGKYKKQYNENPKSRSDIMQKLYKIRIDGKQIYSENDFKNWNKTNK